MNLFELKKFFQQLQLATIQKKLYFSFQNNQDLDDILKILQKKHLIVGYTKNNPDNLVKIFLRYDIKGVCVIQEIKTVSSIRQRRIISVKQIKAFLNDYPYAVALIRTRRGILSLNECWNHRIGGEFLVYLK
jgi:ribosomal protein S8